MNISLKFSTAFWITFALLLGTAPATATVINFDDLSGGPIFGGELVQNQYQALGLTFADSFNGGAHANNTLGPLIAGSSPPNVLWVDQGSGGTTGSFLQINFANPVQRVETVFGTSLNANITMNAFNGPTLIDSLTMIGGTAIKDQLSGVIALIEHQDITSVQLFSNLVGTEESFNFNIDNLTFGAVPEPRTYVLLLSGLALLSCSLVRLRASGVEPDRHRSG